MEDDEVEDDDVEKEEDDENVEEPASLAPIKTTHLTWGLGVRGDLGTRRQGVGIKVYINNHLGFIFLGDMGGPGVRGDLGTRRQGVGIKVYINNHLGGCAGTSETNRRAQARPFPNVEDDNVEEDEKDDNVDVAEDEVEVDDVEDDEVNREEDDDVEKDNVEEEDRSQDQDPQFVRACAVEIHLDIAQEALYARICR